MLWYFKGLNSCHFEIYCEKIIVRFARTTALITNSSIIINIDLLGFFSLPLYDFLTHLSKSYVLTYRSPLCTGSEPRSSRLKDKRRSEGETVIKELFVQNILENNSLLDVLGSGVSVVLLPQGSSDSIYSRLRVGSHMRGKLRFPAGFCNSKEEAESPQSFDYDNLTLENSQGMNRVKSLYSVNGLYSTLSERSTGNLCASSSRILNATNERGGSVHCDGLSDQRLFSCVTCGILSFACVAIVQPREQAARYLMSADCSFFNDWVVGSGITGEGIAIRDGHGVASNSGRFYN